jgi:dethiobiotin synthetase
VPQGFFITGTDTGVGKSEVAAAIAALYTERGFSVSPRKPVESGCLPDTQGERLFPRDGSLLRRASRSSDSLETITPYRFEAVASPEQAAREAGTPLSLEQLIQACSTTTDQDDTLLLVEGAGGFYSPIAQQALNADLATALQLPLILVTEDRLGAINQLLLARQAILDRGLTIYLIILNKKDTSNLNNLNSAQEWVTEPIIALPPQDHSAPWRSMIKPLTPLFFG